MDYLPNGLPYTIYFVIYISLSNVTFSTIFERKSTMASHEGMDSAAEGLIWAWDRRAAVANTRSPAFLGYRSAGMSEFWDSGILEGYHISSIEDITTEDVGLGNYQDSVKVWTRGSTIRSMCERHEHGSGLNRAAAI